jgi:hypothetical protein
MERIDPTDPARHPLAAAVRDAIADAQLAHAAIRRLDATLVRLLATAAAFGEPSSLAEAPSRPGPPTPRRGGEAPR